MNSPFEQKPLDTNELVEVVQELVTFQKSNKAIKEQELEIRKQELENQHSQAKMAYDYSIETLRFNERNNSDQRKQQTAAGKWAIIMITAFVILFVFVITLAMYWDKDQLISEIIRAIILILGSGSVGFGLGKRSKAGEHVKQ